MTKRPNISSMPKTRTRPRWMRMPEPGWHRVGWVIGAALLVLLALALLAGPVGLLVWTPFAIIGVGFYLIGWAGTSIYSWVMGYDK